ncbi:glycolate oxidase [Desulfonatronum thiosulfatophilum]|uniref:Glycolate oxidase n=1 Tax=Desulfonatronum thiosulfatophilum TaxID=617002 RepID=A0A1G6AL26_9BACT|nr:FAD-linked oxidase C-terminal domain-containing protein [Desulfonatronum thiosulfatophilum]SDB09095.1 glycolate oxidase [Desulfonatronum thiosulfatophilum]
MPSSSLTTSQRTVLQGIFPGDDYLDTPEAACIYGTDASRRFSLPWAVVRPRTVDQVRELMAWAHREEVPLFPRARGTNVVGGCVPQGGGVVVSCLAMNRTLEIQEEDFTAEVEPGLITAAFQADLQARGLYYPPDPASVRFSTLGGNVSTCAGGMRALKYGVTRDYVLGIEAVLPGGEMIHTGSRTHKNVVGLDLTRLLVGSAGTLAFFTKLTLKLLPLPPAQATLMAGFKSLADALAAAQAVFQAGIVPVAMELMPVDVLDCVAKIATPPWSDSTKAVLLLKCDGRPEGLREELRLVRLALESKSPQFIEVGRDGDAEERLWEFRRLINPASFRLGKDKISEDVTLPRSKVVEGILGIREIGRSHGLPILTFGHLGDGNIHTNIMFDAELEEQRRHADLARDEVLNLVLRLGGVLSGEHGLGLTKRSYLERQVGPVERGLFALIKRAFDPKGIMNPGKAY